ncbi:MAG: hypothetical protein ACOYEV_12710 [Candidatus Nanopelagicales bacterium]
MTKPPGWPAEVPDPDDPEFPGRASGWLLEFCPPSYREQLIFRRYPLALGKVAAHHATGQLRAAREAYGSARRELAGELPVEAVGGVMAALEATGAGLARVQREVELVVDALGGKRWRPKL